MSSEEMIISDLTKKFSFIEGNIRAQRPRRIFLYVPLQNFSSVFEYAVRKLDFSILCTITGLDEGEKLAFLYHLSNEKGLMLNIKTDALKANPVIKTVAGYFPAADIYERELHDLLGAKVEGLPEGNRYPLPDDWPMDQYPLRKDWKAQGSVKKEAS